MGMKIDEIIQGIEVIKAQAEWDYPLDWQIVLDGAIDTMRKYQMMQADYNARLKADMVAMLTEILLKAEENTVRWYVGRVDGKSDDVVLMETLQEIIQEKINSLKAESEE